MAMMEISVVPIGTGSTSVSDNVADIIKILEKDKVKYELTAMGTIIVDNIDNLFEISKKLHKNPFENGVKRVITTIKIDDRKDKELSIEGKIEAVKKKIENRYCKNG